jgi:ribosomal protein S18 acetylase RimI-like enzyme
MTRLRVESIYGPARREGYKYLRAFNQKIAGKIDHRPLAITLREGNEIVGGLVGETFWGWLAIELLWVSDEQRGKGLGRSLIARAESEARKRGARHVYVNTFSFQAPGFYRKLGYREFGKLHNFPKDHSRHWMMKAL